MQIKIHNDHLNNITKIGKYINWTWSNTKQTWTLLRLTNTKKTKQQFYDGAPNTWTLLNKKTKHDGTQNRHEHYWKIEQHFYRRIQNYHEHYWKTEQHFYEGALNRTQLHFGKSNNRHTRMFVSYFDKSEWFYDRYKGFINKLYTCLPLLVWS